MVENNTNEKKRKAGFSRYWRCRFRLLFQTLGKELNFPFGTHFFSCADLTLAGIKRGVKVSSSSYRTDAKPKRQWSA